MSDFMRKKAIRQQIHFFQLCGNVWYHMVSYAYICDILHNNTLHMISYYKYSSAISLISAIDSHGSSDCDNITSEINDSISGVASYIIIFSSI